MKLSAPALQRWSHLAANHLVCPHDAAGSAAGMSGPVLSNHEQIVLPHDSRYPFMGTLRRYRALRRSPSRTNAPLATRSTRSRVVVAGDAPVMVLYFPAVSPPRNPSGPSRNMRRSAFSCRSLSCPFSRSQHFGFVDQEFHRCNCPTLGFDSDTGKPHQPVGASFCLFDASSTS